MLGGIEWTASASADDDVLGVGLRPIERCMLNSRVGGISRTKRTPPKLRSGRATQPRFQGVEQGGETYRRLPSAVQFRFQSFLLGPAHLNRLSRRREGAPTRSAGSGVDERCETCGVSY